MVDKADVYVQNSFTNEIHAVRYCLPGDTSDLDIAISSGGEESVHIVRTESYLVITLPEGVYTTDCQFSVSNEDLLSWSTMDDYWRIEIKNNSLPPEAPTTVNVEISDIGQG